MIKKVKEILFDEDTNLPVFVLEDGSKRYPYEISISDICDCVSLEWREDTRN